MHATETLKYLLIPLRGAALILIVAFALLLLIAANGGLLGLPLAPYQQKNYVTCLDLGPDDAVFTRGWEAQVELSGDKAKTMKREINTQWIYPPRANRTDAFKAAEWARLVDY